jgi:hypothetical protein
VISSVVSSVPARDLPSRRKNTVKRTVVRLANRGRGHPMIDKSFKYGKEEIKWQKKESLRPTFQRELATRARHSVAVIAETR